mmetsp:Transcript_57002/g.138850  ORF Transcript_57002/g.138850 Transcript_57002/m.138850 type:complete len:586 (-) Transcript_57002:166-1923(-)|eukprot:CAMPEP_0113464528 /NCGR_PEP_ID=MMETSP0014_2-20120614/13248_1 /TAXON_ID=2857 /ORGANISM="Nitzschia sp." /LENGTH=585 /DNA_ID=CAMNT_0000356613 /DNA_START=63 /DNA_END=1820 /DNA_ORIENTATION=+ /assembly_acc=CAM_ASM_000159
MSNYGGGSGGGGGNSNLSDMNSGAEIVSRTQARAVNVAAGVGLLSVLKSNLGPRGTLKLLVGGAGQLKLTKDGLVLLKEMQIQHPTAVLIARTATAQDDVTGDGTTSTVLMCGSLLKESDRHITQDQVHPRLIVEGLEVARDEVLKFLDSVKTSYGGGGDAGGEEGDGEGEDSTTNNKMIDDRDLLTSVALTSLGTKLDLETSKSLADEIVSAVQTIWISSSQPLDLNRIEILSFPRSTSLSRYINGIVLDHGGRHPDMPDVLKNCKIMTLNVSLEYEQTETQSGFFYSSAEEREKLVESERKWLDERCQTIIQFKRSVCTKEDESFVIINQKGVDPLSLDIFAKEGILCLRRAKRRNMERLTLACGGSPIHSLQDLDEAQLGYAGKVSQVTLGDDKFTFVEECGSQAKSCTLLLQGPNTHTLTQTKDAVKDGLRALKNAVEDRAVVAGGGAFEIAASEYLRTQIIPKTTGKKKFGIQAFADSLMVIPKTLAENSGFDVSETILKIQEEYQQINGDGDGGDGSSEDKKYMLVGIDVMTGEPTLTGSQDGVWDNVRVKRQSLYLSTVLASQLLLVDEVMRAGKRTN